MNVTWERFAGRTDVFAVRLSFISDPEEGLAATAEEAASWGALQVWVDGQNLCAQTDQGETLQSAHWYFLGLLEWMAANWNPLLHEEKLPNRNVTEDAASALDATRNPPALIGEKETVAWETEWFGWRARHSLRAARDGGLLPNVVFRRLQDFIEVSWREEPLAGASAGFQFSSGSGVSLLPPLEVAQPLFDVLSSAARHLEEQNPSSLRLRKLVEAIESIRRPQRDERLGWLVGLRTPSRLPRPVLQQEVDDDARRMWREVVDILRQSARSDWEREAVAATLATDEDELAVVGACEAALLFSAVSPSISDSDVRSLSRLLIEQYAGDGREDDPLESISGTVPIDPAIAAWEQGYDLAEALHQILGIKGAYVDVERVLTQFGVIRSDVTLDDKTIRGCSIVGPRHRPTVALNSHSPFSSAETAVRFTLAHELCHLLYDRSYAAKLAIASGPWAPRAIERRANAFAAMFLMPPHLVKQAIADAPDPITEVEGARRVAERLRVSFRAAVEHLYNLTLMTEEDRDELLRAGLDSYR